MIRYLATAVLLLAAGAVAAACGVICATGLIVAAVFAAVLDP